MEPERGAVPGQGNLPAAPGGDDKDKAPSGDAATGGVVRKALTSQSFVEKVALLLLTALLSGILVPALISYISAKAAEREKALEAMKARDAAILQAQAKLLDEVAETILTYETLALDVSWYKTSLAKNDEMHRKAFDRYSERSVDLVSRWRALASRARTLASPAISDKLDAFLLRVFKEQDTPINRLHGSNAPDAQWEEQHKKNAAMLDEANHLIAEIANDLGLSKANLHQ